MKNYILSIFILICTWAGIALSPEANAEYFRHLTLDDGLSQPSVMAINQDKLGRMWLGTREGVNMYDGVSVVAYKGWITDPLTGERVWIGNEVSSIRSDSTGNLFMHIDNDIVKYDIVANRFSRFTNQGNVKALTENRGEIIFIAGDSLMVKNPGNDSLHFQFSIPALGTITHLNANDSVYYVSTKKGLNLYNRSTHRHEPLMPGSWIHSTFISADGTLWICNAQGGLYRKGAGDTAPSLVSTPTAPDGVMGAIQSRYAVEDRSGRIWYGTFTGLFCYDPATGRTTQIKIPLNIGGLSHSSVFGMFCDRQGNIWAGTYYGGANYFSPAHEQFVNFNYENMAPEGLYHSFIIGMVEDRDGNLWFGTDGAGVSCVDRDWNIRSQLSTRNGLRQNNIKALAYHPESHRLFIGTHLGGLAIHDIAKGTTKNLIDSGTDVSLVSDVIHALKVVGNHLFISSRSGLSYMDLSTNVIKKIPTPIIPLRFDIDSDGNLFFSAQYSKNIYKVTDPLSGNPKVSILAKMNGGSMEATDICCTDKGLFATTLGDGVVFFPDYGSKQVVFNTSNSSLPDNYCYAIMAGDKGNVYILTTNNVVKLPSGTGQFESVTFSDFFPQSHIIDECALLPLPTGDILVGSTKGITRLSDAIFHNPSVVADNSKLFFSKLQVHNHEVTPDDGTNILDRALPYASKIRLPHNRNNFIISLGQSDYTTSSGSPSIEYRITGTQKSHWLPANGGEIRYNGLPPGNYTLQARHTDAPEIISIDIEVARPWYSTWWAWFIYILAAGALCYFIIHKSVDAARLRTSLKKEKLERNQIEKLNKEKLVFFTNVSHEFQTPLTLILSHIDLLMSRYKRNDTLIQALGRIRSHSEQMSHLITQLLEFRKLQQNHQILRLGYHDSSAALRHTAMPFVDYADKRGINFSIDAPEDGPKGFYDSAMIDRVLVNIISNAFKYTPDGGSISCSVKQGKGGSVVFRFADTGKGISEKDLPFIFDRFYNGNSDEMKRYNIDYRSTGIGLAFAKSIVDKHHGTITVSSREGEGTVFTVELPGSPEPFASDTNIVMENSEPDVPENTIVPAVEEHPTFAEPENTGKDSPDNGDESLPLLLIVEDNTELRRNLSSFFSSYFRIAEAEDGNDGLKKAATVNPDIIISDVMMPNMSGTEMCRRIKSDINLCHIPVILLTALSASESKIEGLNANADDYVTKPFESNVLLARVDNLIRIRRMLMGQFNKQPVSEIDLSVVNPLDRDLLRRTSDIIDSRMDDPDLDIASLCRELGISRSLFFTKFKTLTGMTPSAFIVNYRLKYAATLLSAQPHISVADVAYQTGFTTPTYFSRCFKKQFGVSPQQYRNGESTDDTM